MTPHSYRFEFFDYIEQGSVRSAAAVIPVIRSLARIESVLDVGCGRGVWLAEWERHGVRDVAGADGSYVDRASLSIPPERFAAVDLSQPIDLGRRFDLVQCLEVAEHLPDACADTLVDSIVRHGSLVLFSAATPGQGGEHHVNEQSYDYWRGKFAARGYSLFDAVRPLIEGDRRIELWYRLNTLLFAEGSLDRLKPAALSRRVPDSERVADYSPLWFRMRRAVLQRIPSAHVSRLAVIKHKALNLVRRAKAR